MNNPWTEVYRPNRVKDVILPKTLRKRMQGVVDSGDIPNMIFYGGPGVGKTTVALALVDELKGSSIMINGSDESGIDALRTKVRDFASTASLDGGQKVVIYDEADALTATTQAALRGFIEEFAGVCRFIFTCNNVNKLIEPLRDRCVMVDFSIPSKEVETLQAKMYVKLREILEENGVEYDDSVLASYVKSSGARWRKILVDLQIYAKGGKIDTGILSAFGADKFNDLIRYLRDKNFKEVQNWVVQYSSDDRSALIRKLYDEMRSYVKPTSLPGLVLILNNWQNDVGADAEIAAVAHLVEIMRSVEFSNG